MLQKLPIVPAQVKVDNTSKNLLNEIFQIIYFLYGAKEITKKVCYNIMNSANLQCKVGYYLYLWTLKNVKRVNLIDYYSIFQIK